MTPYERVFRRLEGKPVDRVPNLNILMAYAAKFIDVSYDKFCQDYRYLVEANLKCNEFFGIDMLSTMSDPVRETSDFGAVIEFPYDSLPECRERLLKEPSDISKLKLFDPYESVRMLDRIKAIELYKKEAGNHYPILGWIEGSFAEAGDLIGVSELMLMLYDEPEFIKEVLEICCQEGILCAKAQIKAGADFIGIGDAAASLISPAFYREFVLPYEKRLIDAIHEEGAKVKLHICGNVNKLLDDMLQAGADIVDVDWMVDYRAAIEKFKGHASINGNFDPVKILLRGTPEMVREAVTTCLDLADEKAYISAGCEVPKGTPVENLKAVDDVLCEFAEK